MLALKTCLVLVYFEMFELKALEESVIDIANECKSCLMIRVKKQDTNGTYILEPPTVGSGIPNFVKISTLVVDGSGLTLSTL